jgi:hypothetical protein
MRRFLQHVALLVTIISTYAFTQNDRVIDSVVAVVNSSPIFQSDWEVAVRFEALMNGRSPEAFTPDEQRGVFNRLVDQILIHQQTRGFELAPISTDEIQERVREVRAQLPGASREDVWNKILVQNGITAEEVADRLRSQLEVVRFLEYRMRPMVRVDQRAVTQYYREQFLPELKKQGGQEVPLAQVSDKIREILTQQRMEEQTALWLQTLRDTADIRISTPGAGATTEMTQSK